MDSDQIELERIGENRNPEGNIQAFSIEGRGLNSRMAPWQHDSPWIRVPAQLVRPVWIRLPVGHPDPLEDYHITHRVFRGRNLNPFRHIPWGYSRSGHVATTMDNTSQTSRPCQILNLGFVSPRPAVPFTALNQIQRTLFTPWINLLLVTIPIGQYFHLKDGGSARTFALNYIAEVPLCFICDYAVDEIRKYIPPTGGDFFDLFAVNTVQVISSIFLLLSEPSQVQLLPTTLAGVIIFNILLLLGLGTLLQAHFKPYRSIGMGVPGIYVLLFVSVAATLIPTTFRNRTSEQNLVKHSHAAAVILISLYIAYVIYELMAASRRRLLAPSHRPGNSGRVFDPDRAAFSTAVEIREPHLLLSVAVLLFAASIVLLYFCIRATVDSIPSLKITPLFVALILLPIPNYDVLLTLPYSDTTFLAKVMFRVINRSLHTVLSVKPAMVLLGWWIGAGQGALAVVGGFEAVVLFAAIVILGFFIIGLSSVRGVHGVFLVSLWSLIGIVTFLV